MKAKLPQQKVWLFAGALVVCGVLLAFFAVTQPKRKAHSPEELAYWTDVRGEVQTRKPNTDEFIEAKIDASILSTETARTGAEGRASFEVLGGVGFDLFEDSRILFEKQKNDKTRITVLEGRLRWKGSGDLAYVEIARQGQLVPMPEVKDTEISANVQVITQGSFSNLVIPTQGEILDQQEIDTEKLPLDAGSRTTVSQEEILNSMSIRIGQFRRCYLNLIQRSGNDKIKANVLISFMILSNGNVQDARVWKANVNDRLFLGCLAEVVERTRFRPFNGEAIRVDEFPLDFE